jgi:hypothetical protein
MAAKSANAKRPTNEQIRGSVVRIIAAFASRDPAALSGAEELAKDLRIPDASMPFLRGSILNYMQNFNPKAKLGTPELRKPKQTVDGVVLLAQQRI